MCQVIRKNDSIISEFGWLLAFCPENWRADWPVKPQVLTEDFNTINSLCLKGLFEIKTCVFIILRGAHGEMDLSGKVGPSTSVGVLLLQKYIFVINVDEHMAPWNHESTNSDRDNLKEEVIWNKILKEIHSGCLMFGIAPLGVIQK